MNNRTITAFFIALISIAIAIIPASAHGGGGGGHGGGGGYGGYGEYGYGGNPYYYGDGYASYYGYGCVASRLLPVRIASVKNLTFSLPVASGNILTLRSAM
jgi:hypothetical protein